MLTGISAWVVILTLVFGGSGATVVAAQDSLPTDFLYPVKTFGEAAHLALTPDPQARAELLFRFSERRMAEILGILGKGWPLREEWTARWQEQFGLGLLAASQLDEPAMIQTLERVRVRLCLQEQSLQTVQSNRPEDPAGEVLRLRARLRLQISLVDDALDDPAAFRLHLRRQRRPADQTPAGNPPGIGPVETLPPGDPGVGPGPGPIDTPPCDTCTPALDGTGPGPGPQYGDEATKPGARDGSAAGSQSTQQCDNCTPTLDGTGPGPGPQHHGEPVQSNDEPASPVDQGSTEPGDRGSGQGSAETQPHSQDSGGSRGGGGSNHP